MLKSSYFCGGSILAVALAFGVSGFAAAQETTVEEVVITGSFIAGTPEDAALPVDVISSKELEARGSPTMVQFIKTIPSSGAVIGENNRFGSGSGAATINLRNLNSPSTGSRTLVLFNGRRVPVSPQSLNSVDINLLPTAAIGRVEVLKDGAAATYGSDAIGGVSTSSPAPTSMASRSQASIRPSPVRTATTKAASPGARSGTMPTRSSPSAIAIARRWRSRNVTGRCAPASTASRKTRWAAGPAPATRGSITTPPHRRSYRRTAALPRPASRAACRTSAARPMAARPTISAP